MVVVPASKTAWNSLRFQVFGFGILTFGHNLWKIVNFSTHLTTETTTINAIDFRYNRITDKNVVYLHDKAISNILICLQIEDIPEMFLFLNCKRDMHCLHCWLR